MTNLSARNITIANGNSSLNQINAIANSYLAQDNSKISKKDLKKLKKEILKELQKLKSGQELSKKECVSLFNKINKNVKKFINGCKQFININEYPNLCSDLEKYQSTIKNFIQDIVSGNQSNDRFAEVKLNTLVKKIQKNSTSSTRNDDNADIGKLLCELNDVISQYTKGLVEIVRDIGKISSNK